MCWAPAQGFRRIPHAAVGSQPVGDGHRLVEFGEQVAHLFDAVQHFTELEVAQLRVLNLVPGSRRGNGRMLASAKRIGAIVVLDALFWLQSRNTLPVRWLLVMVAVTSLGIAFSSCCATRLANTEAPES